MITVPSMFGTESPIGCHSFALKFSLTISTSSGFTRYDRFPPFQGKKTAPKPYAEFEVYFYNFRNQFFICLDTACPQHFFTPRAFPAFCHAA